METGLRSGVPLLRQQFTALLKKNFLLSWRNKRATSLQLLSSLFFIFLIFCIQEAIKARLATTTYYENVTDPPALVSPPIPACEEKYYIKSPCFDFVWSGNSSKTVGLIVSNIMKNNPGRPIPSSKVLSFATSDAVDDWLFKNPMRCPGALHFVERNATFISYGIQTNSTPLIRRGNFEDPTFKFQIPLQIAAEREIARTLLKDPGFSWNVGLKEFAHPALETFSAVGTAGPTFFLATAMFGFVLQVSSLISEKELKLRQALSIMGLYDSAYWLSWLTWETVLTLISSLFIVLFGMMFQFRFFLSNSFGVLFLVFFLFEFNMIGLAFMISTFISKSSSATTVGFSIFIIGFLTQLVTTFGFPYSMDFSRTYQIIWSFFPPNLLSHALKLLGDSTANAGDEGISFQRRGMCPDADPNCVLTIDGIYKWLITTFFLWFFLAIYFDNIIPNSNGVRKSCFYFLYPSYWTGQGGNSATEGSICSCIGSTPPLEDEPQNDEDVLEEEITVRRQATENALDPNVAVQIRGLVKTYPGTTKLIGCCRCQRSSPYHAVKGIWVNFPKDQLFCLLGPNGAGKTTVINCLTGITPVSGGDALIYGYSVRSSVGMSYIRKMIGVCPQFDILWDSLSGKEHLHLFASIKGLAPASIASVAEKSLAEVKLIDAADMRAGSYSGGMKRRLSVAIALIGDPKLVFLDEPTTGMDPITRRHVWDIIEDAKKGRAIVLTTHSMEEADILSDRIAIMARGKLRCIGTSIRLKSKFGAGYVANVSFARSSPERTPNHNANARPHETSHEAVKQFFKYHLGVVPKEENKAFLTFVIPNEKEPLLTKFFAELQDKETEFGISDIQLGLTTLEEVFLNIAKKAELENAFAEGSFVTLNLTSSTSIQILKGARYVGIPGTETAENPRGVMIEVYWEQDDAGELCISGHSDEMPIPPNVQSSASLGGILSRSRRFSFRSHGLPVGTVIDPDQVQRSTGF
ncbi:ABC transporter A family member 2-like [Nymphaea colorata]|uniref:ABC transporter A family member 2-like n=1 Tax=Nymphaea colorata TaxID=210225 RepID=UPI00129E5160|nr:ABC transporter A family member 2-like [Nymphaea colorata]XP_049931233.1 ABC transporter A family member 2-like [Nymphaea colorata]